MSVENRKLEQWIRRQVLLHRPEGECVKLVLRHNGLSKTTDVCQIPTKGPDGNLKSADELVAEVWTQAWDDAEGEGGLQKYCVYAYFADDPLRHLARLPFPIQATENMDGSGEGGPDASEPPTKQGMLAQQMRHNEAIMRTSTMATGDIIRTQNRVIHQLRERCDSLESKISEQWEMYEELTTAKAEREVSLIQVKATEKRKDDAFDQLKPLLPVIINKILGKKLLPESTDPMTLEFKGFMESLTSEQMGKIANILGPGQTITLLDFYERLKNAGSGAKVNGEDKSKEPAGLLPGMASSSTETKKEG